MSKAGYNKTVRAVQGEDAETQEDLRMRSRHLEQGGRTGPILMTWMQSSTISI